MKRLAIIDLGTNTFNLLVIDKLEEGFDEVYSTKIGVGLGLGGINKGFIHQEAMERGLKALQTFKQKCTELNVVSIHPFGTSAVRNAENKAEFLTKVEQLLEAPVEVISGEEEARLIHRGVKINLPDYANYLIMDIGGGSTEFIFAATNEVIKARSFEIGAARIYQSFDFSDPYSLDDCQKVEAYLAEHTGDFFDAIKTNQLVGASGSFETFYELIRDLPYPPGEYIELEKEALEKELERIIFSTQAERDENRRIIPIRKKMAPIAALKIRWIIRKLNIQKITISPYSLKEGVIDSITV